MVAVPGGALAYGGAVDRGARSAELFLLTGQGRLSWRACQLGTAEPTPAARGAHAMEVVGGRLYVVGGYGEVRMGVQAQPLFSMAGACPLRGVGSCTGLRWHATVLSGWSPGLLPASA